MKLYTSSLWLKGKKRESLFKERNTPCHNHRRSPVVFRHSNERRTGRLQLSSKSLSSNGPRAKVRVIKSNDISEGYTH